MHKMNSGSFQSCTAVQQERMHCCMLFRHSPGRPREHSLNFRFSKYCSLNDDCAPATTSPLSEQHGVFFPHILEPRDLAVPFSGGP